MLKTLETVLNIMQAQKLVCWDLAYIDGRKSIPCGSYAPDKSEASDKKIQEQLTESVEALEGLVSDMDGPGMVFQVILKKTAASHGSGVVGPIRFGSMEMEPVPFQRPMQRDREPAASNGLSGMSPNVLAALFPGGVAEILKMGNNDGAISHGAQLIVQSREQLEKDQKKFDDYCRDMRAQIATDAETAKAHKIREAELDVKFMQLKMELEVKAHDRDMAAKRKEIDELIAKNGDWNARANDTLGMVFDQLKRIMGAPAAGDLKGVDEAPNDNHFKLLSEMVETLYEFDNMKISARVYAFAQRLMGEAQKEEEEKSNPQNQE